MIPVQCLCGRRYNARPEHAGQSIRCPCGRHLPIPGRWWRRWWPVRVPPRVALLVAVVCWGWIGTVVVLAAGLWALGDRWWPATLLLYGPRWPVLAAAPVVALLALLIRPKLVLPVGIAILIAIGPLMGGRSGWRSLLGRPGPAVLRVVTFNMMGSQNPMAAEVPERLAEHLPDLILLQECAAQLGDPGTVPVGWTLTRHRTQCLVSRWPVDSIAVIDVVETAEDGMTGFAVAYDVRLPGGTRRIVNLHLETPRRGIERLRGEGETRSLARNILLRDVGSRRTARWVAARAPDAVVAGDFNLPVESVIYRRYWGHCRNAFSERGRGFGYTRILRRWSARIDHVLACGEAWQVVNAFVATGLGSDHLPVVVDLARREVNR